MFSKTHVVVVVLIEAIAAREGSTEKVGWLDEDTLLSRDRRKLGRLRTS